MPTSRQPTAAALARLAPLKRTFNAVMAAQWLCLDAEKLAGSFVPLLKMIGEHEFCQFCGLHLGREPLRNLFPGMFSVHCAVCSRMMSNFLDPHYGDQTTFENFHHWNFLVD